MLRKPTISLHLDAKIYFATQSSKALFMDYARLSLISINYKIDRNCKNDRNCKVHKNIKGILQKYLWSLIFMQPKVK